jgi:hypothetical protein
MVLKARCTSIENQIKGDMPIVYNEQMLRNKKTKKEFMHGQRQDMNLNQISTFSPDLSPIENCWQPPKMHTRKIPHWDDQTTRDLMQEGWQELSQKWINAQVDTMVDRLKDCLDLNKADGDTTGY